MTYYLAELLVARLIWLYSEQPLVSLQRERERQSGKEKQTARDGDREKTSVG